MGPEVNPSGPSGLTVVQSVRLLTSRRPLSGDQFAERKFGGDMDRGHASIPEDQLHRAGQPTERLDIARGGINTETHLDVAFKQLSGDLLKRGYGRVGLDKNVLTRLSIVQHSFESTHARLDTGQACLQARHGVRVEVGFG